jgi:hypothetical protein
MCQPSVIINKKLFLSQQDHCSADRKTLFGSCDRSRRGVGRGSGFVFCLISDKRTSARRFHHHMTPIKTHSVGRSGKVFELFESFGMLGAGMSFWRIFFSARRGT